MKEFNDKVAVITGAASGIGLGLAKRCAKEGMKVVLADVETDALTRCQTELIGAGAETLAVVTDVSEIDDVRNLAYQTMNRFGGAHLLFANAGVAAGASLWESTLNDCQWVLGVNLWGTLHCIREFIPGMIGSDAEGHVVITSSIAGLTTYHPSSLYQLTKHGLVAMAEQLHHDLALRGTNIKVSVLCPGFVNTNIMDAERNRPVQYQDGSSVRASSEESDALEAAFRQMVQAGMPVDEVADQVFAAIVKEKFFVLTHPEFKSHIRMRMEDILDERNPVLPPMEEG
jgi:NAD(P)-dependent dehydrogenase (short-subunit alcohol dehydrogenase family)